MIKERTSKAILLGYLFFLVSNTGANDILTGVEQGFVDNAGIKIHYVTRGEGPLVIMLHGFPDFWYTWRQQMEALSDQFQVVAIDLRGYNKSDKPKGVENYKMRHLIGDVAAVIQHFPQGKAIVVGHDWGEPSHGRWRCGGLNSWNDSSF